MEGALSAADILFDRAMKGHIEVRREQIDGQRFLVFEKRKGPSHRFRIVDNTLELVQDDG